MATSVNGGKSQSTRREPLTMGAMPSAVEDLKDEQVPACLYWSVDQVADWIEELG